mgnify:CR=1 FL=1
MGKEFEDAVFENEVGTVTEPVKTQFGYHIIKINEKNEGRDLEFDEVKDKIFSQLKRQKEQDLYNKKIEELKERKKRVWLSSMLSILSLVVGIITVVYSLNLNKKTNNSSTFSSSCNCDLIKTEIKNLK